MATKRKALGRPALPPAAKRRNVVGVSFTDAELERLDLAATNDGRNRSAYTHRVVMSVLDHLKK